MVEYQPCSLHVEVASCNILNPYLTRQEVERERLYEKTLAHQCIKVNGARVCKEFGVVVEAGIALHKL